MSAGTLEQGGFAPGAPETSPLAPGAVMLGTTVEVSPSVGGLVSDYQEAERIGTVGPSAAEVDAAIRGRDGAKAGWQSEVDNPVNPDVDTFDTDY